MATKLFWLRADRTASYNDNKNKRPDDQAATFRRAAVPSVQRDLGGPVVEGARHKDLLAGTGPPEHSGPGLSGGTLAVALQVLLPRQKLLKLLWRLADSGH